MAQAVTHRTRGDGRQRALHGPGAGDLERAGADPQTVTRPLAPLAALTLGTGVLLGLLTQWGLLRYWWVTIKLALTAILTGVILFVLVPRLGVAADAERLPLTVAPAAGITLLTLIVVLAIYKPPWRLRSRPNRRHELG